MLYHVYTELEHQLEQRSGDPLIAALDDPPTLRRLANLKQDLEFFYGPDWESLLPSPSLHTIRYVTRISEVSDTPHRLAVHHWMRYGGGLADTPHRLAVHHWMR